MAPRAIAVVLTAVIAAAGPATAASASTPDSLSTFNAGYETKIVQFTGSHTVLKIPRATACQLGDGSVAVQAYELGNGKVGASFTSRCRDGVASYTGMTYLGGGAAIDQPISGGDRITVDIESDETQTTLDVTSSAGWGMGGGTSQVFKLTKYTAYATGKLGPGSDVGGLRTQKFSRITVGGARLGAMDSASFSDSCSDVTALRHKWTFNTLYTC